MPIVTVIDLFGNSESHEARNGGSLMELLRDLGLVDAVCGGGASCGTCAVQIDAPWDERLPPPAPAERMLLEALEWESGGGRLSCQLTISDAMQAAVVRLLPAR